MARNARPRPWPPAPPHSAEGRRGGSDLESAPGARLGPGGRIACGLHGSRARAQSAGRQAAAGRLRTPPPRDSEWRRGGSHELRQAVDAGAPCSARHGLIPPCGPRRGRRPARLARAPCILMSMAARARPADASILAAAPPIPSESVRGGTGSPPGSPDGHPGTRGALPYSIRRTITFGFGSESTTTLSDSPETRMRRLIFTFANGISFLRAYVTRSATSLSRQSMSSRVLLSRLWYCFLKSRENEKRGFLPTRPRAVP